jgi:uncharacterized OB-fold protein
MDIDFSSGPLPEIERDEYQPFWRGTQEGKLCFPRCRSCNRFIWYPTICCPYCQSRDIEWTAVKGQGKVYSWTVVRHVFDQKFANRLPMIVALVEFDNAPGVRLVTNLVECKPEDVYASMPVNVIFQKVNQELTLPVFRPASK